MNAALRPGPLTGSLAAPASKSQAHRLLICAALSQRPVELHLDGLSNDISATIRCLEALGADIEVSGRAIRVSPGRPGDGDALLFCGESGSTLRFLLPVVGALDARAVFCREGRLPERPLAPFDAVLAAHGMALREDGARLTAAGRLLPGDFELPGDVSSQYISGLLFALPLLSGESRIRIRGDVQSAGYVDLTLDALRLAGVEVFPEPGGFRVPGGQRYQLPRACAVEGDWSNAAFFLCMGALSPSGVRVTGLRPDSRQGDRAILDLLAKFGAEIDPQPDGAAVRRGRLRGAAVDAGQIPDLVPALAALAALCEGESVIPNAARLRLKESDRLATTARLLRSLGAEADERPDGLVIRGKPRLPGGTADACGDHRIAMAAAVLACGCAGPVTVTGAEAADKSYPRFWADLGKLKEDAT